MCLSCACQLSSSHGVAGSELAAVGASTTQRHPGHSAVPSHKPHKLPGLPDNFPGSSMASLGRGKPKLTDKGKRLCEGLGKHGEKLKRARSISVFTELYP